MKKVLSALVLTSLLVVPVITLAAYEGETPDDGGPTEVIGSGADLIELIDNIGNWIFTILLSVAVIMLVLAGFFWITAGGAPEKVKTASDMLRNALIGVAIGLGAKGLVAVITNIISEQ